MTNSNNNSSNNSTIEEQKFHFVQVYQPQKLESASPHRNDDDSSSNNRNSPTSSQQQLQLNTSEMTLEEKNQCKIACINCRQSHRKCDKLVKGCSYCRKTSKQCVYREPKKRTNVPKSKDENSLSDGADANSSNVIMSPNENSSNGSNNNNNDSHSGHHYHHHHHHNNNNMKRKSDQQSNNVTKRTKTENGEMIFIDSSMKQYTTTSSSSSSASIAQQQQQLPPHVSVMQFSSPSTPSSSSNLTAANLQSRTMQQQQYYQQQQQQPQYRMTSYGNQPLSSPTASTTSSSSSSSSVSSNNTYGNTSPQQQSQQQLQQQAPPSIAHYQLQNQFNPMPMPPVSIMGSHQSTSTVTTPVSAVSSAASSIAAAVVDNDELVMILRQLNISELIEYYFGLNSADFPLMSRQLFDEVLSVIYRDGLDFSNINSAKLLFVSVVTWCLQRHGKKRLAHDTYMIFNKYAWYYSMKLCCGHGRVAATENPFMLNNKELLSEGMNLASAYATLGYYATSGEGDHAGIIIQNQCSFLANLLNQVPDYNIAHRWQMVKYIALMEMTIYQHSDKVRWLKATKEIIGMFFDDATNPIKHLDVNSFNDQMFLIDEAQKALEAKLNLVAHGLPTLNIATLRLSFRLAFDGMRLQVLIDQPAPNVDFIRFVADRSLDNIRNNDVAYYNVTAITLRGIVLVALVHLEFGTGKEDLVDVLRKDLANIRILSNRYDIITQKYTHLMSKMEEVIAQKQSLANPVIHPSVATVSPQQQQLNGFPRQSPHQDTPLYSMSTVGGIDLNRASASPEASSHSSSSSSDHQQLSVGQDQQALYFHNYAQQKQ